MSWEIITEQLKTDLTKIDVKSRAQLVDDSYHLALTKKLNYSITFQLGTYLEKEEDMLPWLSYMKYINYFLQLYEKTNVEGYLEVRGWYFFNYYYQQFNSYSPIHTFLELLRGTPKTSIW